MFKVCSDFQFDLSTSFELGMSIWTNVSNMRLKRGLVKQTLNKYLIILLIALKFSKIRNFIFSHLFTRTLSICTSFKLVTFEQMPELSSRQCPSIRGFSRLGVQRSSDRRKHRCYNIIPNTGKLSKLYNIVPNTKYPCEECNYDRHRNN